MKVFIIIPAFNEENQIIETIKGLFGLGYSIVVIDDGSSNNLYDILSDLPIHFLRHEINLGQGASLQTGMEYALKKGADIIIHFDADGQHNPEEITGLIQPIINGDAQVVLGSRFLRESDIKAIPRIRRIVLRVATFVNYLLTGLKLSDAHNGFRALSRLAAFKIELRENRMAHASEILRIIKKKKISFVEVPSHIIYSEYSNQKGQSTLNSINILFDLIIEPFLR